MSFIHSANFMQKTIDLVRQCVPQNYPASKELVIFSHIPKTAGSALNRNLRMNCKDTFCLHVWSHPQGTNLSDWVKDLNQKLAQADPKLAGKPRNVLGHVGFGLHEFLDTSSCTYITLLRDPVERVISHYYRLKQYGPKSCGAAEAARELDLETFVMQSKSAILDNLQTRFISGSGWHQVCNTKGWQQMLEEANRDPGQSQVRYGACSFEMLVQAKDNLNKYFIFGLQSRFSDSLSLFQKALGWKRTSNTEVHVRSKEKQEAISPATIAFIQERNQFDVELYQYAQELFDSQWNKCS